MSAEVGRNWDEAACLCAKVSGPGPGLTSQLQLSQAGAVRHL